MYRVRIDDRHNFFISLETRLDDFAEFFFFFPSKTTKM